MRFTLVLLFAWAMPFLQGKAPAVEPGFTSLFNGTDLTGWKISGSQQSFTVSDGAIVASGPASHAYYDGAFRNHRFRNFELRIDIMARRSPLTGFGQAIVRFTTSPLRRPESCAGPTLAPT